MSSSATAGIAKVLVIGDVATGKTSVIKRYARNQFSDNYQTTVGVDFMLRTEKVDGSSITIQLWDIAGQDRFTGLHRIFYTHAVAAIIVFDLFNRSSFENTIKWKQDIDAKVFLPSGAKIPVLLLGNKLDLEQEGKEPAVSDREIEAFAKENGFYHWFKCSAKSGANIKPACIHLIQQVARNNKQENDLAAQQRKAEPVEPKIELSKPVAESDGGCC